MARPHSIKDEGLKEAAGDVGAERARCAFLAEGLLGAMEARCFDAYLGGDAFAPGEDAAFVRDLVAGLLGAGGGRP